MTKRIKTVVRPKSILITLAQSATLHQNLIPKNLISPENIHASSQDPKGEISSNGESERPIHVQDITKTTIRHLHQPGLLGSNPGRGRHNF